MQEKIFSFIIPVYNTEKYLPRALDSISNQTFPEDSIETVIVNDGSPNTELCDKIIAEYSSKLHINYIKKEQNEGLFLARKTGVCHAEGKYALFLDADDSYELNTCEILNKYIINEPDYIQFLFYDVYPNKKKVFQYLMDERTKSLEDVLLDRAVHNLFNRCYNLQTLKKIYDLMPDFYSVFAEDYYQSAFIEYYAERKIHIDSVLYNYYRGIGIMSDNVETLSLSAFLRIDTSLQNIKSNLTDFFDGKNRTDYTGYVHKYIESLYLYFLEHSVADEIVTVIMSRLDHNSIMKHLIIRMNSFSKTYRALRPVAKILEKPMDLLRNIRNAR